jgi:hypothetical protein
MGCRVRGGVAIVKDHYSFIKTAIVFACLKKPMNATSSDIEIGEEV